MTGPAPRDGAEVDALVIDRYLESLLRARASGADGAPAPADLDPHLRDVADRLARALPRLHPSFRFEEALAARLTAVALGRRQTVAAGVGAGADDRVRAWLVRTDAAPAALAAYLDATPLDDDPSDADRVRPLLIGGALTSAALSLAGAAYVAWRLRRSPSTSLEPAIRAVAGTRLA